MEESQKPFVCSFEGCSMRFTHEDNLSVHKKKHDMVLNFGNGQKTNVFVADQTPTPTRFIRNCEEVGLFQDLQNVNPFEETFRKAVEASRVGGSHLESLHVPTTAADDTLHTPHVFPNISEEHSSISNLITSTSMPETPSGEKSESREELEPLEVPTILQSESTVVEVTNTTRDPDAEIEINGLSSTEVLIKQETDVSQQIPSRASSVDSGCKIPVNTASTQDTVQVVFHMPDGRLVQLSGVAMGSIPSTQLPVQVPPSIIQAAPVTQPSASPNAVIINTQFVQNAARIAEVSTGTQPTIVALPSSSVPVSTSSTTNNVNSPQERLSAAKMKLKQRIQFNSKRKQISSDIESIQSSQKKSAGQRTVRAPSSEGSDTSVSTSPRVKGTSNTTSDVDEQKLRRFRERNRAAAMRCREKRKHWIHELEKRAYDTQRVNQQLTAEVTKLRSELAQLKTLLLAHKDCSVTKAMQQGVGIAITRPASAVPQLQIQQPVISLPQVQGIISGNTNICASPEDSHPKVVLLSKPAGLKRRRQASLASLTVVESGKGNSKDFQVRQPQIVNVSQPISVASVLSHAQEITKNILPEDVKPSIISESVTSSSPTCIITVAAPPLISGVSAQNIALKQSSVTSTSYLMPTKLCLPVNDSTLPQIIKLNSNILKTGVTDTKKRNNVTHSSGDSMDSGHGSDIEILAEIPNKIDNKS